MAQDGGGGYGLSASSSASSGANMSGATSIDSGGNFGGSNTGPGSLIITDQSGSLGATSGGLSLPLLVGVAGAAIFVLWLLFRK
jgi:hypothetical protein